ncbi:MAG: ATP12 family protein [Rickettsiales bacterium]
MTIPTHTPAKNEFVLSSNSLKEAIEKEWNCHPALVAGSENKKDRIPQRVRYDSSKMPLTALAYTAIDKISARKNDVVEALMVYVDSDALTYRATSSDELAELQNQKWGNVLDNLGRRFDVSWQITSGVMPLDQSPLVHKAIRRYLESLDEWHIAAFCVISSLCSSIALAIAVCEKQISAAEAFDLSRLEENFQAEKWGRDEEAEHRAGKMEDEIIAAGHFLSLLG